MHLYMAKYPSYNFKVNPFNFKPRYDNTRTVTDTGDIDVAKSNLLQNYSRYSDAGGHWVSGYTTVYDDNGFEYDVHYAVELKNNRAIVHLEKQDIPAFAQDDADYIIESETERVADILGGHPINA